MPADRGTAELAQHVAAASEEAARIERETVGKARIEVAVVEESLRSQQVAWQRETALLERLEAQMAARRQRVQELEAEHAEIVARTQALRVTASRLEAQQGQVQAHASPRGAGSAGAARAECPRPGA